MNGLTTYGPQEYKFYMIDWLTLTLTYIFKVTNFEMWISRKRWELVKNALLWLYRGWCSPSIGATTNVALRYIDLYFQGRKFDMLEYISEIVRAIVKMHRVTFTEVNIRHRTTPLWMLYSVTLTFNFKSNIFLSCICYKNCTGSECPQQIRFD